MADSLTTTERLNIAVKALMADSPKASLESSTWLLIGVVILANTPTLKHWVAYVIFGLAIMATLMTWTWLLHRHRFFAIALTEFATAAALILTTVPSFHHIVSVSAAYLVAIALISQGTDDLKYAKQYAMVQSEGWKHERTLVYEWLKVLRGKIKQQTVTEIKERTFWTGNRTYRFLKLDDCRVMAIFRTGRENRHPVDYQVRDSSAISIVEKDGQAISVTIDGREINSASI